MIWLIENLPHGRVRGTCKTCGYPTHHPNLRAAELWARRHDVVTCVMTKQTRDAAARLTTAPRSDEGPHETPTPTHHHPAVLTGAVTTSEEIAS